MSALKQLSRAGYFSPTNGQNQILKKSSQDHTARVVGHVAKTNDHLSGI